MSARDPDAGELRAVAPLVVLGAPAVFVGPVTLVAHGGKLVGVTSVDLLRPQQGLPLAVITNLDGSTQLNVTRWSVGRYTGVAILELAPLASPLAGDIIPLDVGAVHASPDTRSAPAALIAIVQQGTGFARVVVPVQVDADDGGGMTERISRLVSPLDAEQAVVPTDGAPLFGWFAPDLALGRPSEVLLVAVCSPHRAVLRKARATPVLGTLVGLEDLGRLLIARSEPDPRTELVQVAGEIVE